MIVTCKAREQITVSNAVKTLTSTSYLDASEAYRVVYADIQVQSDSIRVTFDGSTAPVAATTGMLWTSGSTYRVWGEANMANLKMIRETTDATIVVSYFGQPF